MVIVVAHDITVARSIVEHDAGQAAIRIGGGLQPILHGVHRAIARAVNEHNLTIGIFSRIAFSMLTSGVKPTPPLIKTTGVVAAMST